MISSLNKIKNTNVLEIYATCQWRYLNDTITLTGLTIKIIAYNVYLIEA